MSRLTPEAQAAIDGARDPLGEVDITEVMAEVGFKMAMDKGDEATRLRAALESARAALIECANIIRPHYPSFSDNVICEFKGDLVEQQGSTQLTIYPRAVND